MKRLFGCTFLIFALILTGCAPKKDNSDKLIDRNGLYGITKTVKPKIKGTINIFADKISSMNPYLCNNYYINSSLALIYEGLVSVDSNHTVSPRLAKAWRTSNKNKEWIFDLDTTAKWHNGNKINGSDVEYSINYLKKSEYSGIYKQNVENISGISSSSNRITVYLYKSDPSFPESMNFPVVSKKYGLSRLSTEPIGTGAYKFVSKTKNMIVLDRNPQWYIGQQLKDNFNGVQPPFVSHVKIKIMGTTQNGIGAFMKNEIDLFPVSTTDYKKMKSVSSYNQNRFFGNIYDFVSFNTKNAVTKTSDIRKAIAYCIDRNTIVQKIYGGCALMAEIPAIPSTFVTKDILFKYSPTKASALLTGNGWTRPGAKWTKPGIGYLTIELLVNSDKKAHVKMADYIKTQLEKNGISVNIKPVPKADYLSRLKDGKYTAAIAQYSLQNNMDMQYAFASKDKGGSLNYTNFSDSVLDGNFEKWKASADDRQRKEIYASIKSKIMDDLPATGICISTSQVLSNRRINGDMNATYVSPYNHFPFLYLSF